MKNLVFSLSFILIQLINYSQALPNRNLPITDGSPIKLENSKGEKPWHISAIPNLPGPNSAIPSKQGLRHSRSLPRQVSLAGKTPFPCN